MHKSKLLIWGFQSSDHIFSYSSFKLKVIFKKDTPSYWIQRKIIYYEANSINKCKYQGQLYPQICLHSFIIKTIWAINR